LLFALVLTAGCGPRSTKKAGPTAQRPTGTTTQSARGKGGTTKGGTTEGARKPGGEPAPEPVKDPGPPADYSLDVSAYVRELEKDRGAIKKYEGKVVELKGVVKSFELSPGGKYSKEGEPAIDLEAPGKEIAEVQVKTRERQPWAWICPGQVIKIKGKVLIDNLVEDGIITAAERSPAVMMNAEALAKVGKADREKASKRYKGRWLIVEGEVVSRGAGESGARLTLKGAGKYPVRAAVPQPAMKKQVEARKPGDKVTLLGRVGGFSEEAVRLQDCLLITAGP
jgi:hypothetical protein